MAMNAVGIRSLRIRMKMTQVEFANFLNVSFATVNRWERGRTIPLPDRMAKLKGLKKRK
jgi:DNA-binding transcriptional regulator YiaG